VAEIRSKIQSEAREGADKAQRDYLLREQMRAIRKELGEDGEDLIEELRRKIEEANMPAEVEERASKRTQAAWNTRGSSRPKPASFAPTWNGWSNCPGTRPPKTTWTSTTCARCWTKTITAWKM
jgi:hypothetical protein